MKGRKIKLFCVNTRSKKSLGKKPKRGGRPPKLRRDRDNMGLELL